MQFSRIAFAKNVLLTHHELEFHLSATLLHDSKGARSRCKAIQYHSSKNSIIHISNTYLSLFKDLDHLDWTHHSLMLFISIFSTERS